MAIVVYEHFDSRPGTRGKDPATELRYVINGTADDVAAQLALAVEAPMIYDGLARQNLAVERINELLWDGIVQYGRVGPKETGESSYSFNTGGGVQHITQSLETVGRFPRWFEQNAPDFKGAIGVTLDNVEGVDIGVPVFEWSETHYLPVETVTAEFIQTIKRLTSKVNLVPWRNHQPGEALFLGASGSQRGEEDWEISFHFAAQENVAGLRLGDIVITEKRGWDYLWIRYADEEDANTVVKRPVAAYVERVSEYEPFQQLGI